VYIETGENSERKVEMLAVNVDRKKEVENRNIFGSLTGIRQENELDALLDQLSPEISWGERKAAAKRIGALRNPEALPALLAALPVDRFWLVRCEIIQALERIADPAALPVLQFVAAKDGFKVVREYAAKAAKRLS
jgi:HEAT repeat protein